MKTTPAAKPLPQGGPQALLSGPIFPKLLRFALPNMGAMLATALAGALPGRVNVPVEVVPSPTMPLVP